jgi:hypothetical protein
LSAHQLSSLHFIAATSSFPQWIFFSICDGAKDVEIGDIQFVAGPNMEGDCVLNHRGRGKIIDVDCVHEGFTPVPYHVC